MTAATVAALYVDVELGPYPKMQNVDCWGVGRNAALYDGPHPVVAHPPCGPWGQMRQFCTKQDPALAVQAVKQVRAFGGVLEHPAGSRLWERCRLPMPFNHPRDVYPWLFGDIPEWSLVVDQCCWGHPARKRTWLFFCGVQPGDLPPIPPWQEPSAVLRPPPGYDPKKYAGRHLPKSERHITPPDLAEWLVAAARSAT